MEIRDLFIKDSSGEKSVTVTAFILGFAVVNLKLLGSGLTVAGLTLAPFSGTEYAAAIAALGAVYVMRRATGKGKTDAS